MKKLFDYIPFYSLIALATGINLQYRFTIWHYGFNILFVIIGILITLLFLFKSFKKHFCFFATCASIFIFLGISSVYIQNPKSYTTYFEKQVTPDSYNILSIRQSLKPNQFYYRYIAEILKINDISVKGKVLLYIKKDSTPEVLKVDTQILTISHFKEISPPLNPHQFNYKSYLEKQFVYHQTTINKNQFFILKDDNTSVLGISEAIRTNIQTSLNSYPFSKDVLTIMNALFLGQRQDISKEIVTHYTNAGAIHILAISGLHVGLILLILNYLLTPLHYIKNGEIIKTVSIVCFLWCFAFIAGLSASVIRAVTMFTFIAIGISFKRKNNIEHSLISSMFLQLLMHPQFFFDVGFQLSYAAVFGIIWIQPLLFSLWTPKWRFLIKFWQLFTVSMAAQIAILPLSLYYFHQFPSLFFISNLIIIPFLFGILVIGIVVIVLSLLNSLPPLLVTIYNGIISYMNNFVAWVSNQESFLFTEIPMTFSQVLIWYLFINICYTLFQKFSVKSLFQSIIVVILIQLVYLTGKYTTEKENNLLVFHKSNHSIIGLRYGKQTTIYHTLDSSLIYNEKLLEMYRIGENVQMIYNRKIPDIFYMNNHRVLILSNNNSAAITCVDNCIILLRDSPKINLERFLKNCKPTLIIADGSNYKSYVKQWELTCKKQKTPFYNTMQNGAYKLW